MKTLMKALRRPTDASARLAHSYLLGTATLALNVIMWRQVRPAFIEIGRGDEFTTILTLAGAASIGMAVALCLKLPADWRQIVADQAKNDAAGCNIVGQKEARNLARYEEALIRAKLARKKAKQARADAR
ncbi:hypothetical protein OIU34_23040 [Pararhizobium sp. BT-229]|uniref:hypothetical protein n=1 Tax=Pararhizobium sp. BT-229 TaxID=2986923 RepID=UPI0021F725E1|nr:hypothetical protein [Pararhizobium sp. BT-229]MCV9964771.1 hypothetical protein [Pararhizobium sp. BT-229]